MVDTNSEYPLAKHFETVAKKLKDKDGLKSDVSMSNDELLDLYGLFKQANEGDNTASEPSFYQLEAKAKWKAWNKQKGKSKEQAKQDYVELALKYFKDEVKDQYN